MRYYLVAALILTAMSSSALARDEHKTSAPATKHTPTINLASALKNKKLVEGSTISLARGGMKFNALVEKGKLTNWQAYDRAGTAHPLDFSECSDPRPVKLCCASVHIDGDPQRHIKPHDESVKVPCRFIQ